MISWFEKHRKVSWAITIFGAVMIFYLSSISFYVPELGEKEVNMVSMIYHVCAFFFFSLFLFVSVGRTDSALFLAILVAGFYGVLDEMHQFFVPGRVPAFSDFVLDSVGILLASMLYFISAESRRENSKLLKRDFSLGFYN